MNTALSQANTLPRLPQTALPMAFVALAALYVTNPHWILPVSAVLLVASQFSATRLDNEAPMVRVGRYVLFALLGFGTYLRFTSESADSSDANFAYFVGQLCAAELAIQAWLRRPSGGSRLPVAVLLSTMVFLAASNTFDYRFIPWLTPLFFGCLGMALRDYANFDGIKRHALMSGGLSLLLAIGAGAGLHYGVYSYRNEISQWGMRFLEGKTVETSGLSTNPNLGASFNFRGSLTRMLRAENLPAFSYLRAMTFADYQSGRWLPVVERRQMENVLPATLRPNAAGKRARIERLGGDKELVFAPLHAAGIDIPGASLEWQRELGPLRVVAGEETAPIYSVILDGETHQGPLCAPPDAAWRARFLEVSPEVDERIRVLARQIVGDAKTAREKVSAVENYLISHHAYSLNARPGSGDKVSDFLLNKRSAHCEYFASAAVLLLRCVGVPSRYAIGYLAHEAGGHNALVVRGRDAHAWAESYVEGGWITVEATPGGGRPEGRAESLPLGFKWREKLTAWLKTAREWLAHLRTLPLTLWLGAVALLFAWLILRSWRTHPKPTFAEEFRYATRDAELASIGARFENWLAKRGLPCPPGRVWAAHARIADLHAAQPFIAAYERARFGPPTQDIADLKRLLQELENRPQNEAKP